MFFWLCLYQACYPDAAGALRTCINKLDHSTCAVKPRCSCAAPIIRGNKQRIQCNQLYLCLKIHQESKIANEKAAFLRDILTLNNK